MIITKAARDSNCSKNFLKLKVLDSALSELAERTSGLKAGGVILKRELVTVVIVFSTSLTADVSSDASAVSPSLLAAGGATAFRELADGGLADSSFSVILLASPRVGVKVQCHSPSQRA